MSRLATLARSKFSLRWLFLFVLAIAIVCCAYFRYPTHQDAIEVVDGFVVYGMWQCDFVDGDRLIYLLVISRGSTRGGSTGLHALYRPSEDSDRVDQYPSGLYLRGERKGPTNDHKVWMWTGDDRDEWNVVPLQIEEGELPSLTPENLANLANASVWHDKILPELVNATLDNAEANERREGYYHGFGLPRREQVDWNNLERYSR